jgi:hypothetical protein
MLIPERQRQNSQNQIRGDAVLAETLPCFFPHYRNLEMGEVGMIFMPMSQAQKKSLPH